MHPNLSVSDIIIESQLRDHRLDEHYDPLTGDGSLVERFEYTVTENEVVRLPVLMRDQTRFSALRSVVEAESLDAWAKARKVKLDDARRMLHEARVIWDFEYWAAQYCTIEYAADSSQRKTTGQAYGKLVLNRAQRIYAARLYEHLARGKPIRLVLLKARQWGGSTMTQALFMWIQRFHQDAWHSFICTQLLAQAAHIRGMYKLIAENHEPCPITLGSYERLGNVSVMQETKAQIGISSIERPDATRSYSPRLVHMSEVGLWGDTLKKNADDYAQAINASVPAEPWTIVVMESTAKGVGNFFHTSWLAAKEDDRIFVAWFEIEKYRMALDDERAFIEQMDDYDWKLWEAGASLTQINWWHWKLLNDFKGNRRRMMNEFPSEPDEAFTSTGNPFFDVDVVEDRRGRWAEPPVWTGMIQGIEGTMEGARLIEVDGGPLSIWYHPNHQWEGIDDKPYRYRYAAFADFGGKRDEADWSVLTVVDRAPMLLGRAARVAARLRIHIRPDIYAWQCAWLCSLYGNALLAYEVNRHKADRGDDKRGYEPEWSLAAIEEIGSAYPHLYMRTSEDKAMNQQSYVIGFHTNTSTKPMILNTLEKALEDETYVEPDERAFNEFRVFEQTPDGALQAVEGNHDDIVISTAGTCWLALSYLPPMRYEPNTQVRHATGFAA